MDVCWKDTAAADTEASQNVLGDLAIASVVSVPRDAQQLGDWEGFMDSFGVSAEL